jgi:urea transporter
VSARTWRELTRFGRALLLGEVVAGVLAIVAMVADSWAEAAALWALHVACKIERRDARRST